MANPGPAITSSSNLTQDFVPQNADGHQVGSSPLAYIGFWGAVPVQQPGSPAANVHTVTAGSTTAVYVNTSFDGSVGSSAYTIGDIIVALKNAGLLAK
jgi:hypothetical protein